MSSRDSLQLKRILSSKNLARLGDALVNFIASAAISLQSEVTGLKVPGKTLRKAYHLSMLRALDVRGIDKGEAVEALLAYAWLNNILTCEDGVKMLHRSLTEGKNLESALANLVDFLLKETLRRTPTIS
jgi:hypothetical protein